MKNETPCSDTEVQTILSQIRSSQPESPIRLEETLRQMEADLFAPHLGVHKLSGNLSGFWACSCGYDCRIVFSLEKAAKSDDEVILLLDIGTHDEVY